jgi:hypothetical protein
MQLILIELKFKSENKKIPEIGEFVSGAPYAATKQRRRQWPEDRGQSWTLVAPSMTERVRDIDLDVCESPRRPHRLPEAARKEKKGKKKELFFPAEQLQVTHQW